jgi:hypothetical protein
VAPCAGPAAAKLLGVLGERPYSAQVQAEERGSPLALALVALAGGLSGFCGWGRQRGGKIPSHRRGFKEGSWRAACTAMTDATSLALSVCNETLLSVHLLGRRP